MIRNKYFILPFLLLAWTIIFVHSIVPHHHHSENFHAECNHCQLHEILTSENSEISSCDNECNDHTCNFRVDILTQFSIDNIFLAIAEESSFNYLSFLETNNYSFYDEFVSIQISAKNYLRGPPSVS